MYKNLRKNKYFILFCICLLVNAFLAENAYCESVPPIPRSISPGAINTPKNDKESRVNILKTQPVSEITDLEITKDSSLPIDRKIKVKISKIIFSGNTIVPTSELEMFTKNILDKEVTISTINEVLDAISNIYRENGYITSYAYLPPQKISEGVLQIAILENKVGNITVKGNRWVKASFITDNVLKKNDFTKDEVLNVSNLRRGLGELNEANYLKGNVTLQKGAAPGTTDVNIDIKDRFPLSINTSADNTGRDVIGLKRANINLVNSNVTGYGDTLSLGTSLASRTVGANALYQVPIGDKGGKLQFLHSYSRIKLGGEYEDRDIRGQSQLYRIGYSHPLYKKGTLEVNSLTTFDFKNSRTMQNLDNSRLDAYKLRILSTGINAIRYDKNGHWGGSSAVDVGIPFMKDFNQGPEDTKYVKFSESVTRVQYLPHKMIGIIRLSGQYTPNSLLASEQFQVGGAYTVRGFTEGSLIGDMGYNATAEILAPVPFLPEKININYFRDKTKTINLKNKIRLAAFYDQGYAINVRQEANGARSAGHYTNFLQSIGCGLRIYLSKYTTASLDLGVPLGRDREISQKPARLHFYFSSMIY